MLNPLNLDELKRRLRKLAAWAHAIPESDVPDEEVQRWLDNFASMQVKLNKRSK